VNFAAMNPRLIDAAVARHSLDVDGAGFAAKVEAVQNYFRGSAKDPNDLVECDQCGAISTLKEPVCPFCGAAEAEGPADAPPDQAARPTAKPADDSEGDHQHTDLGNAERFVERHGRDLRCAHPWSRRWLHFADGIWTPDDSGEVERRAKDVAREMLLAALDADDHQATSWALKSQSKRGIDATIALAASELGVPILPDDLDADDMRLVVRNGTLDLESGKLREHRREDLATKMSPVSYDANASAPLWRSFVDWAMGGDPELVAFLQRWCGYVLTGRVSEQKFVIHHGEGDNGKSTFVTARQRIMGAHAVQCAPTLLVASRSEQHPTEKAALKGARLAVCSETNEGQSFAEQTIKLLTGGDLVTARRMREDFWTFRPTHKFELLTNHRPRVRGQDHAFWRRVLLVPWEQTVTPQQKDPRLPEKLAAEAPGILRWCVEGCLAWRRDGLAVPAAVVDATNQYRDDENALARFVNEFCDRGPGLDEKASHLLSRYLEWAVEMGEHPLTQRELGIRMRRMRYETEHKRDGWYWLGIRLRPVPMQTFIGRRKP
jgi:putative DNA primase/helicase